MRISDFRYIAFFRNWKASVARFRIFDAPSPVKIGGRVGDLSESEQNSIIDAQDGIFKFLMTDMLLR